MSFIQVYREFDAFSGFIADIQIEAGIASFKTAIPDPLTGKTVSQETILKFDDLRQRNDACGFDRWVFRIDEKGYHYPVRNLHADTYLTKQPPTDHVLQNRLNYLFHTIVRPEDISFLDCVFFLNIPEQGKLSCNQPYKQGPRVITTGQKSYWPRLELSELSKSGSDTLIGIQMPASVARQDIFLKSNAGMIPRKVTLIDGQGKCVFSPVGVADGEPVIIKAGFEYFSNVTSISLTR